MADCESHHCCLGFEPSRHYMTHTHTISQPLLYWVYYSKYFNIFIFPISSQHWNSSGSGNPSSWKTRICLSYIINTGVWGALVTPFSLMKMLKFLFPRAFHWNDNVWTNWVNPLRPSNTYTVKCHYNACHYNANASLTRSILGSQTAPTCPHNHPQVAQHMGKRCEIIAVWSATAAMTPLCSHTNGIKQRYPTCWLCQYSRFMIDLRSNTQIIHLRCPENAIILANIARWI